METLGQSPQTELERTARSTVTRHPERGRYERAVIDAILDEALICHVGVVVDGSPRVLPTAHVRVGDHVYLHGARANRLLGALAAGAPACLTVTLLDGLVFSRRAYNHSMNYRSVVVHGVAREVTDAAEKLRALDALVEHMAEGRSAETAPPSEAELRATLVLALPLREASAKVRSGPPNDGDEAETSPFWAGELPLALAARAPKDDPRLRVGLPLSAAVRTRALTLAAGDAVYERAEGELCVTTDRSRVPFGLVHRFLADESYWACGISEPSQARAMQSTLCFSLYRRERAIGFARVLTDGGRVAYLADVFVIEAERGRGYGKWLVAQVLDHSELRELPLWLLGTADAHGLYERFGFTRAPEGRFMVRRRA